MSQVHVGLQVRTGNGEHSLDVLAFADGDKGYHLAIVPLTYTQAYELLNGMADYANASQGQVVFCPNVVAVWA